MPRAFTILLVRWQATRCLATEDVGSNIRTVTGMLIEGNEALFARAHHVCVVGAGPVGLVAAMEMAKLGHSVTVLESGTMQVDPAMQQLSDAIRVDPRRNADMALVVQRRFGGTSNLWGAGCVPLDAVDFARRSVTGDAPWPITYAEFAEHLPAACRYANCGNSFTNRLNAPIADTAFSTDRLMRFADPPSFLKAYADEIASSDRITAVLGVTVTEIRFSQNGTVLGLEVRQRDGVRGLLRCRAVVLACGGVETTRLLLAAQANAPERFGGEAGPLGRYYMGHLSGTLADIRFKDAALDSSFDFFLGEDGAYARRRIVASDALQAREGLTNIAFWPTLPPMRDAAHRDPMLSMAYTVLSIPPLGRRLVSESLRRINIGDGGNHAAHLRNIALGLPAIATTLPRFLYRRFLARQRLPGLHLRNPARRYVLHYHGEHLPQPWSRIRLSHERDAYGMPKAILDLQFSEADAVSIVRTHELLARWLEQNRLGELLWRDAPQQRLEQVLEQAGDGVHQIGTLRMGENARLGVVDRNCRVFGSANLFVAGSAVFPTSGQANPTLSAIALAVRLARFVAKEAVSHEMVS
jgi:choline dehydrogenase-like flavoprotein